MRFRSIALALALACGFAGSVQARHKVTGKQHVKPRKIKKQKIKKVKIRRRA